VDKIAFTGFAVGKRIGKSSTNLEADQPGTGRQEPLCSRMLIWQQQWAVPSSVSTSTAVRFVKPVPVYCYDQRRVHAAAVAGNKDYQIR